MANASLDDPRTFRVTGAENRIVSNAEALAVGEDLRVQSVQARLQTYLLTKVNNVPTLPQIGAIRVPRLAVDLVPGRRRSGSGRWNNRRTGASKTRLEGDDFHDARRSSKHAPAARHLEAATGSERQ